MIETARLEQSVLFVEPGKILRNRLDDRDNGQQKGSSRRKNISSNARFG